MKGAYVCRGSDPVQVSIDVPLSFLNEHIVDAATAVTDFQKSVSEVCITEGRKRNKPKKALTPQKYLWKKRQQKL